MAFPLASLPSDQLLSRLHTLIRRGSAVEAELLAHLGEIDARRLYLGEACSSMFHYCVRVLHFAEAVAYKRIAAARAARRHPEIMEAVRRGDLHVGDDGRGLVAGIAQVLGHGHRVRGKGARDGAHAVRRWMETGEHGGDRRPGPRCLGLGALEENRVAGEGVDSR